MEEGSEKLGGLHEEISIDDKPFVAGINKIDSRMLKSADTQKNAQGEVKKATDKSTNSLTLFNLGMLTAGVLSIQNSVGFGMITEGAQDFVGALLDANIFGFFPAVTSTITESGNLIGGTWDFITASLTGDSDKTVTALNRIKDSTERNNEAIMNWLGRLPIVGGWLVDLGNKTIDYGDSLERVAKYGMADMQTKFQELGTNISTWVTDRGDDIGKFGADMQTGFGNAGQSAQDWWAGLQTSMGGSGEAIQGFLSGQGSGFMDWSHDVGDIVNEKFGIQTNPFETLNTNIQGFISNPGASMLNWGNDMNKTFDDMSKNAEKWLKNLGEDMKKKGEDMWEELSKIFS